MNNATSHEHTADEDIFCTCCDAELNPNRRAWLELNGATNEYQDPKARNAKDLGSDSQGLFPFGKACARRVLKEQKAG